MKTLNITLLIAFLFCNKIYSQVNLVPNPSFEERDGCPEGYPDLDGVLKEWVSFRGSPDYFHNCSSMNGYNNNWGFQEPHSGEGYISIISYSVTGNPGSLMREHLGVQLLSPLTIGVKYYITFYASAAWEPIGMTIANNKTGVLFTTYSYNDYLSELPLNNHCHVWTEDIISDTINWTKISGSFIADSAYTYLVIGNFFDDSYTDTINLPNQIGFNQRAMQYIDDVCVSSDSLYAHNWTTLNVNEYESNNISIYPNPAKNFLNINSISLVKKCIIYDNLGRKIKEIELRGEYQFVIDIRNLDSGMYHLQIESTNGVLNKQIIIN